MYIANAATITPSAAKFLDGSAAAPHKEKLDQEDFLKLLTAQLTAQDPLKPMTDTQFISQMANFSSLEQMRTLAADFADFSSTQLLGKTVTLIQKGKEITGPVTEIKIDAGLARLVIDGKAYDPADVIRISGTLAPPATPPPPPAADPTPEPTPDPAPELTSDPAP